MEFPTLFKWTSSFPFEWLVGGNFLFYSNLNRTFRKQTVKTLIRRGGQWRLVWVSTVYICPTKRTLGLYGHKAEIVTPF